MSTPRSRTMSTSQLAGPTIREYYRVSSGWSYGNFSIQTQTGTDKSVSDWVTDNFQQRVRDGEIIINPLVDSEIRNGKGGGSWVLEDLTSTDPTAISKIRISGESSATKAFMTINNLSWYPIPSYSLENGLQSAKTTAISRIDSTPYDFTEDAFELTKTLAYLRNPFSALRGLSNDFSRSVSRKQKTLAFSRALANTWLEYRFALIPLVNTVSNILVEHIDSQVERTGLRKKHNLNRRTARGKELLVQENWNSTVFAANPTRSVRMWGKANVTASAGIIYEVSNPIEGFFAENNFRFKAIPSLLWQVTPYSWLVDQFVNVSGLIQGLTNLVDPNVHILGGWTKTHEIIESQATINNIGYSAPWTTTSVIPDIAELGSKSVKVRQIWTPTWEDVVPNHVDIPGLKTGVDIVALIMRNFRINP